ncbi:MAG: putative toxin-antitoxin system toxin component, PIN family [Caldilinea sp.]
MAMDRQRRISAVLDTNVLLGAQRRQLLILAELGAYRLVCSQYIVDEMRRVMARLGWSQGAAHALVQATLRVAELVDAQQVTSGSYELWLHDPKDHPIMATALIGGVNYLVTANTHDFPPKQRFAGITVITPNAFLSIVESKSH